MTDIHFDPRTRREVDPELLSLQERINRDFDFDEVVKDIFSVLEKRTLIRSCRLSVLGRDLKKSPLVESTPVPKKGKAPLCPILSYPLVLTNNEIRYTLDVYAFETPSLNSAESDLLSKCVDLLYQAVNKDYLERDHLTNLYKRQGLLPRIGRVLERARAENTPLAVLVFDLDHFKNVNDTYGHPVGDLVLQEFAGLFNILADGWLVGRWGGEEFVAVVPGADAERALAAAEDIRAKTEKIKIWVDKSAGKFVSPTCSAGVSLFPGHGGDAETLIQVADLALYEAKNGGRNRVKVYPLDAPDVRLKKLKETVDTGTLEPLRDLEGKCKIISLRARNIVSGLPLAVDVAAARLYILDGQAKTVRVYDGKSKKFVFVAELGGPGEAPDQLEGPADLAVSADGRVFVVDSPAHAVKVFDAAGKSLGFIGGRDADGAPILGYVKGAFNEPVAASLDGEGRILVAERMNRRVQRFTAAGEFDGLEIPLDATGGAPTYEPDPRDVAADGTGNIYILDAGNSVVHKFDAAGTYVRSLGGPGPAGDAGRFKGVFALAVDRSGNLASRLREVGVGVPAGAPGVVVAAEAGDVNRLQFFDVDGTYLGMVDFARLTEKLKQAVRPGRLTVTAQGNIYLVDQDNGDVLQLSFAGDGY
ncbi:MAG TPA: diguanylate cyclase [bacterium]|nr:diguanylate cyclase [bacterium]